LTGWRLDTIMKTNFAASHHVGRYKQQQAVQNARPYLMYRSQRDPKTRDAHRALDGIIKKQDDPFWDTYYTPNGFNCRCYTKTLSERQMKLRGLKVSTGKPSIKPDEGWDFHVGKAGLDSWKPDFGKYSPKARGLLKDALKDAPAIWKPAKTIKEAEAWAVENITKKVDYSKADLAVVNEINSTLNGLIVRGNLRKLDELGLLPDSHLEMSGDLGYAPGNRIFINRDKVSVDYVNGQTSKSLQIEQLQKRIEKRKHQGWTVEQDPRMQRYVETIEELKKGGHAVDARAWNSFLEGLDIADIDNLDTDIVIARTRKYNEKRDGLFRNFLQNNDKNGLRLSEYATTNADEYIAEAYSAWKSGNGSLLRKDMRDFLQYMEATGE
ncbi:MAG: hypothetical protein B6240_14655, partial [Desulfobacteraceae bacterium 4572_87]